VPACRARWSRWPGSQRGPSTAGTSSCSAPRPLAWNPYTLLDPGFQLSFAAVAAIFLLVPPLLQRLEGYPVPAKLAAVLAVSTACGVATAPILWLQFHAVPLLSVPANALAAPASRRCWGSRSRRRWSASVSPPAAAAIAWLNGWCAAYLAACAHAVAAVPGAQVTSGRSLVELLLVTAVAGAYAWRRWQSSSPRT
jgi:competence protein ComEC